MGYEKKTSPVGGDGVVDFNCCPDLKSRDFQTDSIDVDVRLREDGTIETYVDGCNHKRAYIANGDSNLGTYTELRVKERTFAVIVCPVDKIVETLRESIIHEQAKRKLGNQGAATPTPGASPTGEADVQR